MGSLSSFRRSRHFRSARWLIKRAVGDVNTHAACGARAAALALGNPREYYYTNVLTDVWEGVGAMGTLQEKIASKFLATLREKKALGDSNLEQLEKLLANSKKPKSDDFIKIFTAPAEGEVK